MTDSFETSRELANWSLRPRVHQGVAPVQDTVLQPWRPCEAEVDIALSWRELVCRATFVVGQSFSPSSCSLILGSGPGLGTLPLAGRQLEIIERVLSGTGQNCVAIDMDLAPSTVAVHARQALETLGVSGRPSRVHPLLMLMATAARRGIMVSGKVSYVPSERGDLRVIEVLRPGQRLRESLPGAEREVIGLLVEGHCYVEIAKRRRTAVRTVANQIAAVFRRLNVSGRSELIQRLFVIDGMLPPAATPSLVPPPATPPPPPPTVRKPLSGRPWQDARTNGAATGAGDRGAGSLTFG